MNHKHYLRNGTQAATISCHPERSLATSAASHQTQSKDLYDLDPTRGDARNFRIMVRFFSDPEAECDPVSSREAATECSPRRKPGVKGVEETSPGVTAGDVERTR